MILDTSAIVAVHLQEPDHEVLVAKIAAADTLAVGTPTLVESAIVLSSRLGIDARGVLARFVEEAGVVSIPFVGAHYALAMDAWLRFGRGRHPANLNLGDCFSYATAKAAREPLLCAGDDFVRTDLNLA